MTLTSYLMLAILFLSPLHHSLNKKETPLDRLDRYHSIVSDIAEVATDPAEAPVFTGKFAKERTALLILSIGLHESGYDKNVDDGSQRGKLGEVCFLQVMPNMINSKHNYSPDYLMDRKNCIRAALSIIRDSKCSEDITTMLRAYVSGKCSKNPDPEKAKNIDRYARDEVAGYIAVIYQLKMDKLIF